MPVRLSLIMSHVVSITSFNFLQSGCWILFPPKPTHWSTKHVWLACTFIYLTGGKGRHSNHFTFRGKLTQRKISVVKFNGQLTERLTAHSQQHGRLPPLVIYLLISSWWCRGLNRASRTPGKQPTTEVHLQLYGLDSEASLSGNQDTHPLPKKGSQTRCFVCVSDAKNLNDEMCFIFLANSDIEGRYHKVSCALLPAYCSGEAHTLQKPRELLLPAWWPLPENWEHR